MINFFEKKKKVVISFWQMNLMRLIYVNKRLLLPRELNQLRSVIELDFYRSLVADVELFLLFSNYLHVRKMPDWVLKRDFIENSMIKLNSLTLRKIVI